MPITLDATDQNPEPIIDIEKLFRPDRRKPMVTFGHCAITGEWGTVVSIDLGDLKIKAPEIPNEEPQDIVYHSQLTVSAEGLRTLLQYVENSDNPIPEIVPDLAYQWSILYADGSGLNQYYYDDTMGQYLTYAFPLDRQSEIKQLSLIPRIGGLPVFTYNAESSSFYVDGKEVSTEYVPMIPVDTRLPIVATINTINVSSHGFGGLSRTFNAMHTATFLLGFIGGGWGDNTKPRNIIAVDSKGFWRPYDQLTWEEIAQNQYTEHKAVANRFVKGTEEHDKSTQAMQELVDRMQPFGIVLG